MAEDAGDGRRHPGLEDRRDGARADRGAGILSGFPSLLFAVALALLSSIRSGAADAPPYVTRGDAVEARYGSYRDRLDRLHDALAATFEANAPDLSVELEPPAKLESGYQILPKIVPDAPVRDRPKRSQASLYSWPRTEKLMDREIEAIGAREADLERAATLPASERRAAYETLAAEYKKLVKQQRTIDSHVHYNRFWQAQVAGNRSGYDRFTELERATLDRQAIRDALSAPDEAALRERIAGLPNIDAAVSRASVERELRRREAALDRELEDASGSITTPSFVRFERRGRDRWVLHVPVYTDIADEQFVRTVHDAIESVWRVRDRHADYRVEAEIRFISPAQLYAAKGKCEAEQEVGCGPKQGEKIDLGRHVSLFPEDGAVLTTGALSLHVTAGRAIALGPNDLPPHALAHEFGHVLGFQDRYYRGYRDLGADGYEVSEVVADPDDIMGAPGFGPVLRRHFEKVIAARSVQTLMEAGLDALYKRHDPAAAATRFREVLELNPKHYGATYQLAKALDESGKTGEAFALWKKVLDMAEAAHDQKTARTARARIAAAD